ncbi:MAG: hypothetical protein FWC77_05700 [Defluviitaleaceae bacterium]|nr:hypothetical protein [Defluviitaleaceae bacterium]
MENTLSGVDNGKEWTYTGSTLKGKRHGYGTCTWTFPDERIAVYAGEWISNRMHGMGKYTGYTGNIHEGGFASDGVHGNAKGIYSNGDVYDGEYTNDMRHGKGKYTFANGDIAEGEFAEGYLYKGKVTFKSTGEVYEGELAVGKGVLTSGHRHPQITLEYFA